MKSTVKIPKPGNILSEVQEEEKARQEDSTSISEEDYGETPFTEEDLKKAWSDYAENAKNAGRDSDYAILKQKIRLEGNDKIIITFTNSVKTVILDRFRADLITYLKSTLKNRKIHLETELTKEDTSNIPYTNGEKFEYMVEKKPILNELRNRLGLDPDF